MADDEPRYEHQSMKVVRGRESRKIAEMQQQRWELVSQTQGTLRTEMTFRRVKKWSFAPWMGAVAALVGLGAIVMAAIALGGDDSSEPEDPSPTAASTKSEKSTDEPSQTPIEEPPESEVPTPPDDEVLTIQNNRDFKALLEAEDDYRLNKAFAKTYGGREIRFDGSVADATPGYYLVYSGDDSDTNATSGPAFQFRVQNLQADGRPVVPGDNLRFVAQVMAFDVDQGLFFLAPVSVSAR